MNSRLTLPLSLLFAAALSPAATLQPETLQEFKAYMDVADREMAARAAGGAPFFWCSEEKDRWNKVQKGEVVIGPWRKHATREVTAGLIHDWVGSVFVPGVTLKQAVGLLQDVPNHTKWYSPSLVSAKLISKDGDHLRSISRVTKKKVVTVVLETEYDSVYQRLSDTRYRATIRTVSMKEVKNAGEASEVVEPPDTGFGFLWRLNSYWQLEEKDNGVYMELRSVSLTRDIPAGVGWMVHSMVNSVTKEELTHTLEKTRDAVRSYAVGPAAR